MKLPEYNLKGDLETFLTYTRHYRYQNKKTILSSKPLQKWFVEFIQCILKEAYCRRSR